MQPYACSIAWLILFWISAKEASAVLLSGWRADGGNRHEWKSSQRITESEDTDLSLEQQVEPAITNVYLIRHGENIGNAWMGEHHSMYPVTPEYIDGQLTDIGVKQAVSDQYILDQILQLGKVPSKDVQLASSLLSRAYDTMLIGTEPIWKKWLKKGDKFMVHQVPAAMELDSSINGLRKPGTGPDEPVRWQDSILSTDSPEVAELLDAGHSKKLLWSMFYQTEPEQKASKSLTVKPVQVQSFYERNLTDWLFEQCETKQLENFADFLEDAARIGKKHIVVGSHSTHMMCMMTVYGSTTVVPSQKKGLHGPKVDIAKQGIPNGAVLHVHMIRSDNRPIVLEPQVLYTLEEETY